MIPTTVRTERYKYVPVPKQEYPTTAHRTTFVQKSSSGKFSTVVSTSSLTTRSVATLSSLLTVPYRTVPYRTPIPKSIPVGVYCLRTKKAYSKARATGAVPVGLRTWYWHGGVADFLSVQ
jgi:hypothetical protein